MPKVVKPRELAMRWLARREYPAAEIRKKLQQKDVASAEIEELITKFQESGYINDSRYAAMFLRYRISAGYGPRRIQQELLFKGVAASIVEDAFAEQEVNWLEVAKSRYLSKYSSPCFNQHSNQSFIENTEPLNASDTKTRSQQNSNQKEYAKRVRYLMARGFDGSLVSGLIRDSESILAGGAPS